MAAMHGVPKLVISGVSGITTLLSAVLGFLQPSNRRQLQMESSKEFRFLMLQMIRCETEREYEQLWKNYNKEIIAEPFLPKKYKVEVKQEYTMSSDLMILIDRKEDELETALADSDDDNDQGKAGDGDNITIATELGEDTELMGTVKRYKGYGSIKSKEL